MDTKIALLVLLLLVVGCGSSAAYGTGAVPPAPLPGQSAADAQATLSAWNLQQQATAEANRQATAVAQSATQVAISSTEQAQAIATGTAQAAIMAHVATQESLAAQATTQAMNLSGTREALSIYATSTADALSISIVATQAADEAQRLANARYEEQVRAQRQQIVNTYLPAFLIFVMIAIIVGLGAFLWRTFTRKEIHSLDQGNGLTVHVLRDGNNGWLTLPAPRIALPAPAEEDVVDGTVDLHTPDWSLFERWNDPYRALIGMDSTGRPLAIDRNREPHLLAVGTTGTGKSTGVILPYTASMLGVGVHALLLNGRGSDFKAFTDATHPNVTVGDMPGRDIMPEYLAGILNALVKEAERRDNVLKHYGVRNWSELPAHAGQSGEIVVVIDEFLGVIMDMADMDKSESERMWRNLIILTSEARKYGIFVLLTATDPTARALGKKGYTVVGQMARLAFTMKNADASQKLLTPGRDWPRGSAGLPQGQFLANIVGQIHHGVAFHPNDRQIVSYLDRRDVGFNQLPDGVATAVRESGISQPRIIDQPHVQIPEPVFKARTYGEQLEGYIQDLDSINALGRFLLGRDTKPSQTERDDIRDALQWRMSELGCRKSAELLRRFQ